MKRFALRIIGIASLTLVLTSCAPNVVEVHKGAIVGYGETRHPPLRTTELIGELDINLRDISNEDRTNLWLEFANGEKMTFEAISLQQMKQLAASEDTNTSNAQITYSKDGYAFSFDGSTPVKLMIFQQSGPPQYTNVFSKVGSLSSNQVLTLPCTLKQFEAVFGKPDQIDRKWMN